MSLPCEGTVEVWGGMECTINRVGDAYFDQLHRSGHWHRNGDIALFASLGLKKIRYPVLWEQHQPRKDRPIDWTETTKRLDALRGQGIEVIAGLVHHGSGPAFVEMTEPSFAGGLEAYAGEVARQFPWIGYYSPVNEPLTTARFCGLYGLWYPHQRNDRAFCRILINECRATVMAMAAIRAYNPSAKLVQTDDLGKTHSTPALAYQADFENHRRWLSFDLLAGRVDPGHPMWAYLTGHGITARELEYFLANPCPPDVLGVNYYLTSERYLDDCLAPYPPHTHGGNAHHRYADVEAVRVAGIKPDGLRSILKTAWERYQIPVAVTEVHLHCTREEQMRWLHEAWLAANGLKKEGIPILAITPWALLGSFGWDRLLTERAGTYEPGAFDISSGRPRATALVEMVRAYSRNEAFAHPALSSPGWWRRSCRCLYGNQQPAAGVMPAHAPLEIRGIYAAELAQICSKRCLDYQLSRAAGATDGLVAGGLWAVIVVNEYMEVRAPGRPALLMKLNAGPDLVPALNAGLDLFLDGEHGHWQFNGVSATEAEPVNDYSAV